MEDAKLHDEATTGQAEPDCERGAADAAAFGPHGPGHIPYPQRVIELGPHGPGTIPKVPDVDCSVLSAVGGADQGSDAGGAAGDAEPSDARAGVGGECLSTMERPRGPGSLPVKS